MPKTPPIYGFATQSIHACEQPDATGARATPIYQTASFVLPSAERAADLFAGRAIDGFTYSRSGNPTSDMLERRIAALAGGTTAVAVGSGQAAVFLALEALVAPGDDFIASQHLFGGTVSLFADKFARWGSRVQWVNPMDAAEIQAAITPRTKAIFVETISNPEGVVADLSAISAVAKAAHIPLLVDNTLATPYLCKPIDFGADIVIYSTTKFLNGHGNACGGLIVDAGSFNWGAAPEKFPLLAQRKSPDTLSIAEAFPECPFAVAMRHGLTVYGPAPAALNGFLTLTGIETLALRMREHCKNAQRVAEFLAQHTAVKAVHYAGLPQHPSHALAKYYMPRGAGAVLTVTLRGGFDAATRCINALKLFTHLANVGETRSLVIHPATTTHRQFTDAQREKAGIEEGTLRLSIGIEESDDLIADLQQALEASAP